MGCLRPATPGFLVCLAASVLLALVVFSVPYIKSIYFLKASLSSEGISGDITFGVLGYCMTLPNGTTCSSPSVGYELNVNELVGDSVSFAQIPTVLVKWITYALVLHIVALILAAIAALFGLLAHVREMSMQYCSSFVSGFAGAVAFFAFVFDLVLFFVTKSRINSVSNSSGSASLGIAVWLTLASWLCLFFAGCFYGLGRCCIRNREPRDTWTRKPSEPDERYAEQMRLDAINAEADRKARQAQGGEIGLPTFQEYEQRPLTSKLEDEEVYVEDGDKILPITNYAQQNNQPSRQQFPGGYSQAPVGSRAVDAYYSPSAYPPTPGTIRQPSLHVQGASGYTASTYSATASTPGQAGVGAGSNFLPTNQTYGHAQQPTAATTNYGHQAGGTSYFSAAATAHQQYPSYAASTTSSRLDNPYDNTGYAPQRQPTVNSPALPSMANPYARTTSPPQRGFTLGGGGYGANTVPHYADDAQYYAPQPQHASPPPPPISTSVSPPAQRSGMSPRGPRPPDGMYTSPVHEMPGEPSHYEDSPPVYDAATAQPPGVWGAKH